MTLTPLFGIHEPVSSLSHLAAAALTLFAGWRLIHRTRGNGLKVGAALLYVGCLLSLFSASGVYHGLPPGPWRGFFRRLDYMAIWLVIAGSATPIHLLLLRGFWRWGMLALLWGGTLTSLVLLDRYYQDLSYGMIVALYLSVGGFATISLYKLHRRFSARTLAAVTLGCCFYAAGAVIDAYELFYPLWGVFGPHELFHFCVVAGAACHYLFIYGWAELRLRKVRVFFRGWRVPIPARVS